MKGIKVFVTKTPGVVFKTFYFLHNFTNRPYKLECFILGKPFQPSVMEHSSLSGPFIIYEENEVLWILSQRMRNKTFYID